MFPLKFNRIIASIWPTGVDPPTSQPVEPCTSECDTEVQLNFCPAARCRLSHEFACHRYIHRQPLAASASCGDSYSHYSIHGSPQVCRLLSSAWPVSPIVHVLEVLVHIYSATYPDRRRRVNLSNICLPLLCLSSLSSVSS